MLSNSFIEVLQNRFQSMLPKLELIFTVFLLVLKRLPEANSLAEALYIYEYSQKVLVDSARIFENRFLRTLSDTEICVIYNDILDYALNKGISELHHANVSAAEIARLQADIPAAIDLILPKIVQYLRGLFIKLESFPLIEDINDQYISRTVLETLASSQLFNSCDADMFVEIRNGLEEAFNRMQYCLNMQIFDNRRDELEIAWEISINKNMTLKEIYDATRQLNNTTRRILPEWPVLFVKPDLQVLYESPVYSIDEIGKFNPTWLTEQVMNNLLGYFEENNLYEKFMNEFHAGFKIIFAEKFGMSLKQYVKIIANAHITLPPEARARLCKSNVIVKLFFSQQLSVKIDQFLAINFATFVQTNQLQHLPSLRFIKDEIYPILRYELESPFYSSDGLFSIFMWPLERAVAAQESSNDVNISRPAYRA